VAEVKSARPGSRGRSPLRTIGPPLAAAAVFLGHLSRLRSEDLGFRSDHVLLVQLDPAGRGYSRAQLAPLYRDLLARFEAIPGVRSASIAGCTPIQGCGASAFVNAEGFVERLKSAIAISEAFFHAAQGAGCEVVRVPNGTNVFRLVVPTGRGEHVRARLQAADVLVPAPTRQPNGDLFGLQVNETWNRTTATRLADAVRQGLNA